MRAQMTIIGELQWKRRWCINIQCVWQRHVILEAAFSGVAVDFFLSLKGRMTKRPQYMS